MKKSSARPPNNLPRPRHVDDRIDHDVGDVHALRPEIARHRLGEDALRRLGGREAGEVRLAAQRRRVAGRDERAAGPPRSCRREPAREMQERHDVDAEVPLESAGSRSRKVPNAPATALWISTEAPELARTSRRRAAARRIADVADERRGCRRTPARARPAARGRAPASRRDSRRRANRRASAAPVPGPYASDEADRGIVGHGRMIRTRPAE